MAIHLPCCCLLALACPKCSSACHCTASLTSTPQQLANLEPLHRSKPAGVKPSAGRVGAHGVRMGCAWGAHVGCRMRCSACSRVRSGELCTRANHPCLCQPATPGAQQRIRVPPLCAQGALQAGRARSRRAAAQGPAGACCAGVAQRSVQSRGQLAVPRLHSVQPRCAGRELRLLCGLAGGRCC